MVFTRVHYGLGIALLMPLTSCLMLPSPAPYSFHIRIQNRATVCTEGIRVKAPVDFWNNRASDGSTVITPTLPAANMGGTFYGPPQKIDFELSCLPGRGVVSYTVVIEEWNQQLTTADPLRILLITETASEPLGLTVAAVAGRE